MATPLTRWIKKYKYLIRNVVRVRREPTLLFGVVKRIRTARHDQLNIYTDNKSYQNPFAFTDG